MQICRDMCCCSHLSWWGSPPREPQLVSGAERVNYFFNRKTNDSSTLQSDCAKSTRCGECEKAARLSVAVVNSVQFSLITLFVENGRWRRSAICFLFHSLSHLLQPDPVNFSPRHSNYPSKHSTRFCFGFGACSTL